jgi:DNA-directed RNA polymerase subunit RPC12/RpoP
VTAVIAVAAAHTRERGRVMRNYKCTDCKKFFNIDKGTYDKEWGFHCIYCGGIGESNE